MKKRNQVVFILFLILSLQFFLRIPFLNEPFERDEGVYGYMAQRILEGEVPYRDVFDHKPPAVYYIYAAVIKPFGSSLFAVRLSTAVYGLLTTLSLFGAGYLLFGTAGGLLSAFLYALFSGTPLISGAASNTESFMVLPMILALYCFLLAGKIREHQGISGNAKEWLLLFLAGLFSGLAVMMKPVALFNFLVLLGFIVFKMTNDKLKMTNESVPAARYLNNIAKRFLHLTFGIGHLTLGFIIFPLFFTLYFYLKGALPDFIYGNIIANQVYIQTSPAPFFFADPRWGWFAVSQLIKLENGPLWLLSAFALFSAPRLLAFWGFFSFLGVTASGLFFGHYFIQVIPALCLLSSYALIKLAKETPAVIKFSAALVLIALVISNLKFQLPFYFKYNPYQISHLKYMEKNFGLAHLISTEMSKGIGKKDGIFVWAAEPEVYFYLKKKAPSKYPSYIKWMENLKDPSPREEILKGLAGARPRYVIYADYRPPFPALEEFIGKNYNERQVFMDWKLLEKKTLDFSRGKP